MRLSVSRRLREAISAVGVDARLDQHYLVCGRGPTRWQRVGPHPHPLPALALLAPLFSNIWLLGLAICPKQSPQRSGGVSAYPRLIRVSRWPNWWRAKRRPSEQIADPSGPLPLNIGAREARAGSHGGGAPWVSRGWGPAKQTKECWQNPSSNPSARRIRCPD
jgi:hypothetical protein